MDFFRMVLKKLEAVNYQHDGIGPEDCQKNGKSEICRIY